MSVLSIASNDNFTIVTNDTLSAVLTTGYLNGTGPTWGIYWTNYLICTVYTSDTAPIQMHVVISGSDTSLVIAPTILTTTLVTSPHASLASTLALGTAYQNTLGYDVLLMVYVNVTSALTASFLLGVGPTNAPTQQTIVSGLTIAALGVVPVTIYLPTNYYAKLSVSGTIAASIGGQIVMPI